MSPATAANIASFCIGFMLKSSLGAGAERGGSSVHQARRSGPAALTVEDASFSSDLGLTLGAYGRQAAKRGIPPNATHYEPNLGYRPDMMAIGS